MKSLSVSFFLFSLISVNGLTELQQSAFEDYCWRDYDGDVPSDAFQGGHDKNGKPIYVGQVLFHDVLILGKMYVNDARINFEHNDVVYTSNESIKILCSKIPRNFEWLKTSADQVLQLTNKILIKGGYEKDYYNYIGRVFTDGETSVGKVIASTTDCWGLYTTNNSVVKVHSNFEILTYNPKFEKISTCTLIDLRLKQN